MAPDIVKLEPLSDTKSVVLLVGGNEVEVGADVVSFPDGMVLFTGV